jgi:RNA polymerase sigma-70 factor (ECF subfamily)
MMPEVVGKLFREESGRILATLIRLLGDFDLAEEVLQEAFAAAVTQWPREGTPANPRAWIIQAARHKAVDRLRRQSRFAEKLPDLEWLARFAAEDEADKGTPVADDRLRLIF